MITELKQLPHSLEAEQMTLGAILLDNCLDKVSDILTADMFYQKEHKAIYSNMLVLFSKRTVIDAVTLYNNFSQHEQEMWDLANYFNNLVDAVASSDNVEDYAKIVLDRYKLRQLINITKQCTEAGYNAKMGDINDIGANLLNKVTNIINLHTTVGKINNAGDILDEIQRIYTDGEEYLSTGDALLDYKLKGGFGRGNVVIIAGKTAMGKTTITINLVANMSKIHKTIFFSLEMSFREISKKIFSNCTTTNISDGFTEQSLSDLTDNLVKSKYLGIVDYPRISVEMLKRYIVDYKVKNGSIDVVFIDYLQLMERPKCATENEALSYVTRELKLLAKELDILIICLSQVNRGSADKKEKRPLLSDLRGSGSIEQDADYCITLHRESYVFEEVGKDVPQDIAGVLEFIVSKARHCATFTLLYNCDLKHSKLIALDKNKRLRYKQYINGVR